MIPCLFLSLLSILPLTHAALYHPTPALSFLEHILVDNWGAYASNFSSAITPCTRYISQTSTIASTSGRTTAAQWMRVMFHDFVTANVSAGTGGIDASIGFETAREENKGSAFSDSFAFWRPFVGADMSSKSTFVAGGWVVMAGDTMNSDLRLYESDKNMTMRTLFAQGAGFLDTCVELMGRAIDTVPAGVQLSEPVTAMPVKPVNVTYDFGEDGRLMLSGKIRILTPAGTSPPPSLNLRISQYETKLEPEVETGSSVFGRSSNGYGTTSYYPFSLSGPTFRNATSFSVYGPSISEQTLPITSQVFIVPSMTALRGSSINVTIAIGNTKSCDDLTVLIVAPFAQHGTLAPKMSETSMVMSKATAVLDEYILCQSLAVLQDIPTGLVKVQALLGEKAVDTLLINGGTAGW